MLHTQTLIQRCYSISFIWINDFKIKSERLKIIDDRNVFFHCEIKNSMSCLIPPIESHNMCVFLRFCVNKRRRQNLFLRPSLCVFFFFVCSSASENDMLKIQLRRVCHSFLALFSLFNKAQRHFVLPLNVREEKDESRKLFSEIEKFV